MIERLHGPVFDEKASLNSSLLCLDISTGFPQTSDMRQPQLGRLDVEIHPPNALLNVGVV